MISAERRNRRLVFSIVLFFLSFGALFGYHFFHGSARLAWIAAVGAFVVATRLYGVLQTRDAAGFFWLVYIAGTIAGLAIVTRPNAPKIPPAYVGAVLLIGGVGALVLQIRDTSRFKELERFISREAAAFAFCTMFVFTLTYALLETNFRLPHLSMWVPWLVGFFAYFVSLIFFAKRLT